MSPEAFEAGVLATGLSQERKLAFEAYFVRRRYPGRAAAYAIMGDLTGLALMAGHDPHLKADITPIARFLRFHAPISAWGSAAAMGGWIDQEPAQLGQVVLGAWAVALAGAPLGIVQVWSWAEAWALGQVIAMGLELTQAEELSLAHLDRLWAAWIKDRDLEPADLQITLISFLPSPQASDNGVPKWGWAFNNHSHG